MGLTWRSCVLFYPSTPDPLYLPTVLDPIGGPLTSSLTVGFAGRPPGGSKGPVLLFPCGFPLGRNVR